MAKINIESNIDEVSSKFGSFGQALAGPVKNALATVRTGLTAISTHPILAVVTAITAAVLALGSQLAKLQGPVDEIQKRLNQLQAAFEFVITEIGAFLGLTESTGKSLREVVTAAGELSDAQVRLEEQTIKSTVRQAELRAELSEYRAAAADVTKTEQERIAALEEAGRVNSELFAEQRMNLQEEVRILEERQALGESSREERQELANLQAQLIQLTADENNANRELIATRTGLEKTIRDQNQRRIDEEKRRLEEEQRLRDEAAQKELEAERAKAEQARAEYEQMQKDKAAADAYYAEVGALAVQEGEFAKQDAALETAQAVTGFLTGLLGESKGAQIAGLVATNAFEAAKVITSGARSAAEATASANALSIPTFGASLAALPAVLTGITSSTSAGLTGVATNTALGIANILAAPGAKPKGGGGSASAGSAPSFGPTVSTPEIGEALNVDEGPPAQGRRQPSGEQTSVVAVVEQGSVADATERQGRLNQRRSFTGR